MKGAIMQELTPTHLWEAGYHIVEASNPTGFRYRARFWVEDSGIFDTPEEAIEACTFATNTG